MVGEGGQVRPSLAGVVRLFEGVLAGWCGGGGAVFFPLSLSCGGWVRSVLAGGAGCFDLGGVSCVVRLLGLVSGPSAAGAACRFG